MGKTKKCDVCYTGGQEIIHTCKEKTQRWEEISAPQTLQFQKYHQLPIRSRKQWSIRTRCHSTKEKDSQNWNDSTQMCFENIQCWATLTAATDRHCLDMKTSRLVCKLSRKEKVHRSEGFFGFGFLFLFLTKQLKVSGKKSSSPRSHLNLQLHEPDTPPS